MIVCFSGTGNTARCARLLARYLGDSHIVFLDGDLLLRPEAANLRLSEDDRRVVWAFPVYSWGVPPVVVNFIRKINLTPEMNSAGHYALMTCGDDAGLADRQLRRLLGRRGCSVANVYTVIMPNTYVLMKGFDVDSAELAASKIKQSEATVAEIARRISTNEEGDILQRGKFAGIKSHIIYPWFVRFAMSPRPFHSSDKCIACGKCAAVCPMENIELQAERPRWGNRCALCLGCYHVCPRQAVEYGKETRGKGVSTLSLSFLPGGRASRYAAEHKK